MDKVIKEGTLRLLITESTCDVILSCRDHRLMAHKLVLSIASPVFRELLRKNLSDTTSVLILPDINSSTMSTILDYIYTGTTVVYSHALDEFLSVAKFLEIAIDSQNIENILQNCELVKKHDNKDLVDCSTKTSVESVNKDDLGKQSEKMDTSNEDESKLELDTKTQEQKYSHIKHQKRLPDLLPIDAEIFRKNAHKRMCNIVVPSPWCQRDGRSFLGDPRIMSLGSPDNETQKSYLEDTNNNFQVSHNTETTKHNPKSLDTIIRHLYLNKPEARKENSLEIAQPDKCSKIKQTIANVPALKTLKEKTLSERLELPKFTNFPFSRHLAELLPFGNKYLEHSSSHKDYKNKPNAIKLANEQHNCNEPMINPSCYDGHTRKSTQIILENYRKDNSSNNLQTFNSSYSPTHIHPSEPISSIHSPTQILPSRIVPIIQPNKEQIPSETISNTTENSDSIQDKQFMINENSNDNSTSSDSSSDDKKELSDAVKKKAFKCEDCGKCFSQLRNYKYHRSVHEGTKEFSAECPECGKTFSDRGYLSSHMKIHRDRKEYACPNCPKRFNQRVAYNMHLRIHTGIKPHECPTCGKSFSRKMLLKQHQRVHTGERPYSCPECGKTFADRSNMSLHTRLHTGVKPYACTICPKSFTKKHHLKTHMNFHTGLKPYTCENCGLAFSQSSNMRTHYKKCILKEDKHGNAAKAESLSSADNNSS